MLQTAEILVMLGAVWVLAWLIGSKTFFVAISIGIPYGCFRLGYFTPGAGAHPGIAWVGAIAGTAAVIIVAYIVIMVALALISRGLGNLLSLLAPEPVETEDGETEYDLSERRENILQKIINARSWVDTVSRNYFGHGIIVGSDPRYFRLAQRRSYLHADPEVVNYELQWLKDHLARHDEEARERVKNLERELDADHVWSP